MAENNELDANFRQLLHKESPARATNPVADVGKIVPPSKTDATGQLLSELFKDNRTGIVNYQNGGKGILNHKGTRLGFALHEIQGQVQIALDAIPDGLSRGKLGDYRDMINALHKALGRPEVNISLVDQLSGKPLGHRIAVPESKVMELSGKLQADQHQINQIIGAFASGDDRVITNTLQSQQAMAQAESGSKDLNALLEGTFRPPEKPEVDARHEFQQFVKGKPGNSQEGHAEVKVLAATASAMGIASAGAKAALTHLAPAGIESAVQAKRAGEISDLAERHLSKGLLNPEQYEIINQYTTKHAVAVSAASLAPDPTGLSSDVVAKQGDDNLVERLVATGLTEQQAKQYRLGSLTGSLKEGGELIADHFSNLQNVKQEMASHGKVSLSLALNIKPEQLQELGDYSNRLGDKLLQREISNHPDFKALAHLPPEQIGQLAKLAAAGVDPKVQVLDGEISTISQRPQQLSQDPKQAFTEAATYILQSGDHKYRAPSNSPVDVQATVAAFGKLYQDLAQDGGMSTQDMKALALSARNITQGFENNNLQGVVANYTAEQQEQISREGDVQLSL